MLSNQVGYAEVISFRTTRFDPPYKYPLEGIFKGTSVSHVALKITFNNKELFDTYIAGNPNVHYNNHLVDPSNGAKLYEVYFSFWPQDGINLVNTGAELHNYIHDCEQAALGSPMTYNPRFTSYLNPDKRSISTLIPFLSYFFRDEVTLPPSIILHTTRLQNLTPQAHLIVAKVEAYSKLYETWCDALLAYQNAKNAWCGSSELQIRQLKLATKKANDQLLASREQLKIDIKDLMFADQELSDAQFMQELDQFITFGSPGVDSVTLPLVHNFHGNKHFGLEIEPMLQYIKDIADNLESTDYNIASLNCATVVHNALAAGVQTCASKSLKHELTLPWYVRWLSFPVTPAMVMQQAAKAQNVSDMIRARPIHTVEVHRPHLKLVADNGPGKKPAVNHNVIYRQSSSATPLLPMYDAKPNIKLIENPDCKPKQLSLVNVNIKKI